MNVPLSEVVVHSPGQAVPQIIDKEKTGGQNLAGLGREAGDMAKRSKFALHRLLEPIRKEIESELRQKLSWRNIVPITLTNYMGEFKRTPILSICKLGFIVLLGYGEWNFTKGIFAGEVLLKNTPFTDLFSNNVTTQNNAGGAITNAVQDVQFFRDGILILGTANYLLFHNAYRRCRNDIVEECFNRYLQDETLPRDLSNELFDLKKQELNKSLF